MKARLPIDDLRAGRISAVNPPPRFVPGERVTRDGSDGKLVGRVLAARKTNGENRCLVEWTITHQCWVCESQLEPAD